MKLRFQRKLLPATLALATIAIVGCGSGSETTAPEEPTAETTTEETTAETPSETETASAESEAH